MAEKDFLSDRVADAASRAIAISKPVFLDFYEPAIQYSIDREIARSPEADVSFFGGHEYCERRMAAIFPKGMEPEESEYPLACLQASIAGTVNHQDVLGALTSAGAAREGIGDIAVREGSVQVFLSKSLAGMVIDELDRISRYSVSFGHAAEIWALEPVFSPMDVVVASLRADAVIHAAWRMSRSEAVDFIKADRVRVNHKPISKPSVNVKPGDILSVRSKGRLVVDEILGSTKKGNMRLRLKKYS